jgi:hypothetical protein
MVKILWRVISPLQDYCLQRETQHEYIYTHTHAYRRMVKSSCKCHKKRQCNFSWVLETFSCSHIKYSKHTVTGNIYNLKFLWKWKLWSSQHKYSLFVDHAACIGKKKKGTHFYNIMEEGHLKYRDLDGRIIF